MNEWLENSEKHTKADYRGESDLEKWPTVRVSFPAWFVCFFLFLTALREGQEAITAYRATIQKLKLQEKPYLSGHRNWGKGAPACWRRWKKSWKGERWRKGFPNSVYKPTQVLGWIWSYIGMGQTHTNIAKALRIELKFEPPPRDGKTKFAIWT